MSTEAEHESLAFYFASEEDEKRAELKEAILEVTREEVQRTLFELLSKQSFKDATSSSSPRIYHDLPAANRKRLTKSRPKTTASKRSSSAAPLDSSPLFQKRQSRYFQPHRQVIPLEIDVPKSSELNRPTSALLQKTEEIVTKATGHGLKKFSLFDDKEDAEAKTKPVIEDAKEETKTIDDNDTGIQRVESWNVSSRPKPHISFLPTETGRLLRTSLHSVTKTNILRPATTALERRSVWVSTASSERSKAQEIGHRLLGPITLESKRPNYSMAIPSSLQVNEWENELARNIIKVFSNKVRSDIKECDGKVEYVPPATAVSERTMLSGVFFENEEENVEHADFQRISISRGQPSKNCFDDHDDGILARSEPLRNRSLQPVRTKRKGRVSGGALRLRMIWLTGTGMVTNWQVLDDIASEMSIDRDELFNLEKKGHYMKYIRLVEASIIKWASKTSHEEQLDTKQRLWRQLVVTSNGFAIKSIEQKKYPKAMELLDKSLNLIGNELTLLPEAMRNQLTAATKETQAYYYIRRSKPSASFQYVISAINIYKRSSDPYRFLNIANCRLHEAFIYCKQNKHDKSMKTLEKILSMVESGVLDSSHKQQVLLLISITYHNIAVQELFIGRCSDACVSSQNARRLARLCLSLSSHYLPMLESTHKESLNQLSQVLQKSSNHGNCQEANLFHGLITELFD